MLHPQALALLATLAPASDVEPTVEEARRGDPDIARPVGPAVVAARDETIPGADGQPMRLRFYVPPGAPAAPLPTLVFFHGGGWVAGDLDTHDSTCRWLALKSGCQVVAVEYRCAPEAKFPAAPRDAYAALRWLAAHAGEQGVDATRLAVGGDSAGGNIAAAVTLMARDRGGPALAFQLLVYPVTHHAFDTPSYERYAEGFLLTRRGMQWNWNHYLPEAASGRDPLASPLLAPDLRGLPPALLITAECDPLCDESEAYGRRLADAGVPVEFRRYDGMLHAFFTLEHLFDDAHVALGDAAAALRRALGNPSTIA
jgi:acetyl esterase